MDQSLKNKMITSLRRHPAAAAACLVLCAAAVHKYGIFPDGALYCAFFTVLLAVSLSDLDTLCIPDLCHILILILGIIKLFAGSSLLSGAAGFFVVSVPLLLLALFFGGFGGGDIKLSAACGFFLGGPLTVLGALLGCVGGACFSCVLILLKKAGPQSSIPFGPFLSLGFALSALYGAGWLNWYLAALF